MPDSNKSVFISAVLWIEELNRLQVNPNGLGLFEPNSMFFEVGPVLLIVPLEFDGLTVFYRIYNTNHNQLDEPWPFIRHRYAPAGVIDVDVHVLVIGFSQPRYPRVATQKAVHVHVHERVRLRQRPRSRPRKKSQLCLPAS